MSRQTCVHCQNQGTEKTVEWNPVDERWQCRDVVGCAKRAAEAKLAERLKKLL